MTAALDVPPRRRGGRLAVVLAFSLLFLWELWGAVANLIFWLSLAAGVNRTLTTFAWVVLLAGLTIPVAAFAAALVVGRGRGAASRARILLVAYCASQAVTLSVLAYFNAGIGVR
jgi:hypothetical protein